MNTPGRRALYSNLGEDEEKAMAVDYSLRAHAPDGWRGGGSTPSAKEKVVMSALWDVLQDEDEVERIFEIVKKHKEY